MDNSIAGLRHQVYQKMDDLGDCNPRNFILEEDTRTKSFIKHIVIVKVTDDHIKIYEGSMTIKTGNIRVKYMTVNKSMIQAIKNL